MVAVQAFYALMIFIIFILAVLYVTVRMYRRAYRTEEGSPAAAPARDFGPLLAEAREYDKKLGTSVCEGPMIIFQGRNEYTKAEAFAAVLRVQRSLLEEEELLGSNEAETQQGDGRADRLRTVEKIEERLHEVNLQFHDELVKLITAAKASADKPAVFKKDLHQLVTTFEGCLTRTRDLKRRRSA